MKLHTWSISITSVRFVLKNSSHIASSHVIKLLNMNLQNTDAPFATKAVLARKGMDLISFYLKKYL